MINSIINWHINIYGGFFIFGLALSFLIFLWFIEYMIIVFPYSLIENFNRSK